jgi:nitrite reductase/ring-hydroxylating ferredoxin subunit/DMSO/TMAO reductase YedYZ heme-binding membrane subunit
MAHAYVAVSWNAQKKRYDRCIALAVAGYLATFVALALIVFPGATLETLLIRAFGTAAFLVLHVVLSIGPLCRLDARFLPLLYNRRHLGVTMFLLALVHGALSLVQFHALGNMNPLVSLFTSEWGFDAGRLPFQLLGFAALVILFLMAATSHDFWLASLGPRAWKSLHMGVYLAYALLVLHVAFGILQSEDALVYPLLLLAGCAWVVGLHLAAARRESRIDRGAPRVVEGGAPWIDVCAAAEVQDGRARIASAGGERVAVFRDGKRFSAVSNVCRHQNGPLGEGRILDGCVTCPWHGYQYLPRNGRSPAPFTEKVATYRVRIRAGRVELDPRALAPGTEVEPALLEGSAP